MAGLVLLLSFGVAKAAEDSERARNWGFGWEDGLAVRRQFGAWQVGVTAGPNDSLSDNSTFAFDPDLPDSLQGILDSSDEGRTESGYVRLHLARQLASHRTLALSGLIGGGYSWADMGSGNLNFNTYEMDWSERRTDSFRETWHLRLGGRVAWYPVPFVSLEMALGLLYQREKTESDSWRRRAGELEWSRDHEVRRSHSFRTFDNANLLYDLHIIIWL